MIMLRFLLHATKVVGLTYKLAFTSVLLGALVVGTIHYIKKDGEK